MANNNSTIYTKDDEQYQVIDEKEDIASLKELVNQLFVRVAKLEADLEDLR